MKNSPDVVVLPPPRRASKGPLPDAIRAWADWIYLQAELALRTTRDPLDWEGQPATWLDFCGIKERELIEAAMRANVWSPGPDA